MVLLAEFTCAPWGGAYRCCPSIFSINCFFIFLHCHVSHFMIFLLLELECSFVYRVFGMCLPIAAVCTPTQDGETALDYAKECLYSDRREESVALLE